MKRVSFSAYLKMGGKKSCNGLKCNGSKTGLSCLEQSKRYSIAKESKGKMKALQ